jgi:hypothetical protein
MPPLSIVAVAFALSPSQAPPAVPAADPCSCLARAAAPCEAYWRADHAFVGRVESIRSVGSSRLVAFTVLDGIRGVRSSAVEVATGRPGHRCSLSFRRGAEYIVYAMSDPSTGALTTDACSRTRPLDDAGADLEYVRSIRDRSAGSGSVSGRVVVERRDLSGRVLSGAAPLAGVPVRVSKDGVDEVVSTNLAGDFAAPSRGAGRYSIAIELSSSHYADVKAQVVELRDARACGAVTFAAAADGRVTGRVVAADGAAVHGLTVEIATTNQRQRRRTITDRDGRYELVRVPPGRFVLRAGERSPVVGAVVTAGGSTALDDVRLPAGLRYVPLTGFVVTSDGTAAEGARVYLKAPGEGARILSAPVTVDFLGRFTVAGLAGADYRVFAELVRDRRLEASDERDVRAAAGLAPVRLVVRRRY